MSKNFDKNSNGYLSDEEVRKIEELKVGSMGIKNLKGIEHFTALKRLYCGGNELTELDLSKNHLTDLICRNNHLATLDVSPTTRYFATSGFNSSYCSPQTVFPLKITSTDDTSYPYQLSFSSYMTSDDFSRVASVQGLDSDDEKIKTTYSNGIAQFVSRPAKVTYKYNLLYKFYEMSVTIEDIKYAKPIITTASLTLATVGKEYSLQLEASGTPAPTFRITSGKLPAGLTLDSDGTISGIPTKAGSFRFTVRAENSVGYAQKQFTLKVLIMPVITTESLKAATVGTSYSAALTATGSTPITWTLDGDLPEGLKFTNGKLTGNPKENGTFTFTVTATNSAGDDTKTLSLDVHAVLPVFGTTPLPVRTWNKAYSAKISIKKGTKPITVTMSGNLPEGLEFDANTLTISGTPKETCSAETLTFTAENAEGSTSKSFTLTIKGTAPKIKAPSITPVAKGKAYTLQFTATGTTPITWSAVNLPEGLAINSETGEISGTPTEYGRFTFTVTAKNETSSAKKTLTLVVIDPPEIIDDIIPEGDAEESYKYTLEYTGDSPMKFSVSGGNLPNGLRLSSAGKISGTPKESGEFTFTVTAENSAGSDSKEITLIINAAPPRITGSLKAGKIGAEYSSGLKLNAGSLPVEWSCEGDLPSGLEFDSVTGIISGTPQEAYNGYIVIKAENSGGVHKKRVRLRIKEDKTAEKSSLPEEHKEHSDKANREKSSAQKEFTDDGKEILTEKITGRIYRTYSGNTVNVSDGLMIAALLGEISCDMAGLYDIPAEISGDVPIGAELVYIANSDMPSDDDNIAEFFEDGGNETAIVPESRKIIVSIWLNPERIYNPVIAVKR